MTADVITETAHRVFGHEQLWPGQYEAVRALLDGHDVLLVGSTGSGKSLAYQLPAVLMQGPTLVVSPLLALQADQATRLDERGDADQGPADQLGRDAEAASGGAGGGGGR